MRIGHFLIQEFCPEDELDYGSVSIKDIAGVFVMLTVGSLISVVILIFEYFVFKYYKGSKCEARVNEQVLKFERIVRAGVEIYEKILRCGRAKRE